MQTLGIFPRNQNLCGRTSFHGEHGTHRNGITQTAGTLNGSNAYALVTLTAINLSGLTRAIEQGLQNRASSGEQTILASSSSEFSKTTTEHETAVLIAQHEAMTLQRDGQAVCRRACKTSGGHELAERGRARLKSIENTYGLVEHADAGMDFIAGGVARGSALLICSQRCGSHNDAIMPSHIVKYQIGVVSDYLSIRPCRSHALAATVGSIAHIRSAHTT